MVVTSRRSIITTPFKSNDNNEDPTSSQSQLQQQQVQLLILPCSKYFLLSISSTIVFVIASAIYVWLEFVDLDYYWKTINIPDYVLETDDDSLWAQYGWEDDDYVYIMAPGPTDEYLISKYSILYFDASLGFVIVGILDYMNYPGWWSIFFILAGITGVISAGLVEWDEWLSNIFNSISVHLFLIEALGLLYRHSRSSSSSSSDDSNISNFIGCVTLLGDVSFVAGAFGDVILSYFSVVGNFDVIHAQIAVGCAFAWLLCSLIYLYVGIYEEIQIRNIYYQYQTVEEIAIESESIIKPYKQQEKEIP